MPIELTSTQPIVPTFRAIKLRERERKHSIISLERICSCWRIITLLPHPFFSSIDWSKSKIVQFVVTAICRGEKKWHLFFSNVFFSGVFGVALNSIFCGNLWFLVIIFCEIDWIWTIWRFKADGRERIKNMNSFN